MNKGISTKRRMMRWNKWMMIGLTGLALCASGAQAAEKAEKHHHRTKAKPVATAAVLPEAKSQDLYSGDGLNRWLPKAEKGDIFAQYVLGHMYCVGRGVPKNLTTGISWYQRAADQGFAPGQLALGTMYYNGEGVKQDYTVAAKWFRLAADKGYDRAQSNLAALYLAGKGVPQDYHQAFKWFRAAAGQGYAAAQYNLSLMYLDGMGVEKPDPVAAYALLRPLADHGNTAAATALKNLEPKLNDAQIKQGQLLAAKVSAKGQLNAALDDYQKIASR